MYIIYKSLPIILLNGLILHLLLILKFDSTIAQQGITGTEIELKCEPLSLRHGQLRCTNPSNPISNNCDTSQEIGTIATFKCNPHFILKKISSNIISPEFIIGDDEAHSLKCNPNGQWNGLAKFKSVGCTEECGKRLTNPKPLVVNGVPTNVSYWPWHATLFRKITGNKFLYICGGTIISRLTILTAAHCVTSATGTKLTPDSTMVVVHTLTRNFTEIMKNGDSQIMFNVTKIFVSDSYDYKKQFQGDIAVLQLERAIEFSDFVSPACLPRDFSTDSIALAPGKLTDVVGFGADETGELSNVLKHAVLEIKSRPECFARLQQILTESQFCAGGQKGKLVTVCNGDSGGGLFHPSVIQEKYIIHGIVSTSDAKSKRGLCENYAVFTRVYSFVFWIRDVLEEIHNNGDIFLQLESDLSIPYIQTGTEAWRKLFFPVPAELKNKVTEFQVTYTDINPELFLSSLELSRNVRLINLTQVKFQSEFSNRKVLLPHLEGVYIDILPDNFLVSETRDFPSPGITKDFLDSFVFWEKEIEEDGKLSLSVVERLPRMKTDFSLQVNIFKLLQLNHANGKITMAQIPFSNKILNNLLSLDEFKLEYLAISRSPQNISLLITKSQNLKYLILDEVILQGKVHLSNYLQNCKSLLTFVFISLNHIHTSQIVQFRLRDFPKTLRHLSLTRTNLIFTQNSEPDVSNSSFGVLDHLETFYCNECFPAGGASFNLEQLSLVFPNLRRVVINLNFLEFLNLENFIQKFEKLETVFIKEGTKSVKYVRENGKLIKKSTTNRFIWGADEFSHLDFLFNRKMNFWSSESDFNGLSRLSMAEREAMRSGHYRFNGGRQPLSDGTLSPVVNPTEDVFSPISPIIQKNLVTFEVFNAEIRMIHIVNSLRFANRVKYVHLINVTVIDSAYTWEKAELPHLVEYFLYSAAPPGYNTLDPLTFVTILEGLVQNAVPVKQSPTFDFRTSLLQSRVPKIQVHALLTCNSLDMDLEEGLLTTVSVNFMNNWLRNPNQEKPIKKLSYGMGELDPLLVPTTVVDLNLNFAVLDNDTSAIRVLLRRLISLKHLKLINIRVEKSTNYKRWKIPQVYLEDFPATLESFAIERARLNFRQKIRFEHLKFVYFESCGFEPELAQNLMSIFLNLKKLVILGKSKEAELILLSALKSSNVDWVLSSTKLTNGTQVKSLLGQGHTNSIYPAPSEKYKLFIVERIDGIWMQNENFDESQIKSQLLEMKGIPELGTGPQCLPNTWHLIKKSE